MFKVLVIACSVAVPENCYQYHDTRGPYETQERCASRAYDMGNDIAQYNKGKVMPKSYRCIPLKGSRL